MLNAQLAIYLTCISNIRQGQLRGALRDNLEVIVATVTSHTWKEWVFSRFQSRG